MGQEIDNVLSQGLKDLDNAFDGPMGDIASKGDATGGFVGADGPSRDDGGLKEVTAKPVSLGENVASLRSKRRNERSDSHHEWVAKVD